MVLCTYICENDREKPENLLLLDSGPRLFIEVSAHFDRSRPFYSFFNLFFTIILLSPPNL